MEIPLQQNTKINGRDKVRLFLLLLVILLLPLYLLPSGMPQVSHWLLALFAVLSFFCTKGTIQDRAVLLWLWGFTLYGILVNITCSVVFDSYDFLMSSIYLLFNAISFTLISSFLCQIFSNQVVRNLLIIALLFSLLMYVIFYFVGIGRYNFKPRYNGFFNDPNQMAFWSLCVFSAIAVFSRSKVFLVVAFLSTLIIVLASMSRSALVGIFPIILGVFFKVVYKLNFKVIIFILLGLIVAAFFIDWEQVYDVFNLEYLFDRVQGTNTSDQLDVRGYNLPKKYPEYLLFGSGQGSLERFSRVDEIHSTWVGVLFYYGVVGLVLFAGYLWSFFKNLKFYDVLIALGPLFYSFSTYGLRTPSFFIFLAFIFASESIRKK